MGKKMIAALAAVVVLGAAGPALAQSQVSPPRDSEKFRRELRGDDYAELNLFRDLRIENLLKHPTVGVDAYASARGVADCLYTSKNGDVVDLLGGPLSADPNFSALSRAMEAPSACLRRQKPSAALLIGAALAEKLLAERNQTLQPRAMSLDMDVAEPFYAPPPGATSFEYVGRCFAVFSPGLVQTFLRTEVGSKEEAASLDRLYTSTPECGIAKPPAGIPPIFQRAGLAYALEAWVRKQSS